MPSNRTSVLKMFPANPSVLRHNCPFCYVQVFLDTISLYIEWNCREIPSNCLWQLLSQCQCQLWVCTKPHTNWLIPTSIFLLIWLPSNPLMPAYVHSSHCNTFEYNFACALHLFWSITILNIRHFVKACLPHAFAIRVSVGATTHQPRVRVKRLEF